MTIGHTWFPIENGCSLEIGLGQRVTIYGFGSYFAGATGPADIDLLIVHRTSSSASCGFAIESKNRICATIAGAHITMLSEQEEKQLKFIKSSGAKPIGILRQQSFRSDIDFIFQRINTLSGK
jgi:hypothetical protein